MSRDRTMARRAVSRAFRPDLEGQRLEPRVVLSSRAALVQANFLLTHPQLGYAYAFNNPKFVQGSKAHWFPKGPNYQTPGHVDVQTARGGSSVNIATADGSRFRVSLSLADNQYDGGLSAETGSAGLGVIPTNQIQAKGTVRAYPMPGGKVGLIVDGDTQQMQLTIDPLPFAQRKGYAHSFAYAEGARSHVLNIGSLQVNGTGIQAILGFHSADLSGPLSIPSTGTVDRIAFDALLPGAAIGVGGTLNTLDVANNIVLDSGPGISVGGDLNLFNVGQSVMLTNGASIKIARFIGLTPQPPKGSGTGSNVTSLNQSQIGTGTAQVVPSVSAYIQGSVTIGPGSVFSSGSGVANSSISGNSATGTTPSPIIINGSLNAFSNASVVYPNLSAGTQYVTVVGPSDNPVIIVNNLVARNGIHVAT